MRCNDCNKFVSFDTDSDPEIDVDVDNEGHVTGSVRIVNTCQDCSSELTEATLNVDMDFASEIVEHRGEQAEGDHATLSVDHDGGSRTDRTENKDRNGKIIKQSRYMKRFYGAEATITVECACGEKFEQGWSDEVQASGMDEL